MRHKTSHGESSKVESLLVKKDDEVLPTELQGAMECGVCLNLCERPVQLNCGHTYCEQCVHQLALHDASNHGMDEDRQPIHLIDIIDHLRQPPIPQREEIRLNNNDGGQPPPVQQQGPQNNQQQAIAQQMNWERMGGQPAVPPPQPHPPQQPPAMIQPMPIHRQMNMNMYGMAWGGPNGIPHQVYHNGGRQQIQQPQIYMNGMRVNGGPPQLQGAAPVYNVPVQVMPNGPPVRGPCQYRRQDTVSCPECRTVTIIPYNGLPVNYKLQDLIERVRSRAKQSILPIGCVCNKCQSHIPGSSYFSCKTPSCKDEASVICSMCGIRYHNGHDVVEHRVLTIDELEKYRTQVTTFSLLAEEHRRHFNELREMITEHTGYIGDILEHASKEFSKLDSELNRSEAFTEDAALLRVSKAEQMSLLFDNFVKDVIKMERSLQSESSEAVDRLIKGVSHIMQSKKAPKEEEGNDENNGDEDNRIDESNSEGVDYSTIKIENNQEQRNNLPSESFSDRTANRLRQANEEKSARIQEMRREKKKQKESNTTLSVKAEPVEEDIRGINNISLSDVSMVDHDYRSRREQRSPSPKRRYRMDSESFEEVDEPCSSTSIGHRRVTRSSTAASSSSSSSSHPLPIIRSRPYYTTTTQRVIPRRQINTRSIPIPLEPIQETYRDIEVDVMVVNEDANGDVYDNDFDDAQDIINQEDNQAVDEQDFHFP